MPHFSAWTARPVTLVGALLLSTTFTAPAFADIEVVVVTAERRSENLQTVPVAVTAFPAALRDKIGITSIQDMSNFTPGMTYSTATDRVTMRGISRQTNVLSADSGVANYSDGIYQSFAVEAGRSALDLDRVEILRGPQGTLYGRNSIGGAINQITPRPTDDFSAEVRANVGAYGYADLEGVVNIPIDDIWKTRFYGNWEYQGSGWAKSIIPGRPQEGNIINKWYVEGQIQGQIGPSLDVWARVYSTAWNNQAGDAGAAANGWTPADYPTFETGQGTLTANPGYGCTVAGPFATANTTAVAFSSPLGAAACINPSLTTPWKIAKLEPTTTSVPGAYFGTTQITYHTDDDFDIKYIGGLEWYRYVLNLPLQYSGNFDAPISSVTINGGLPQAIPLGLVVPGGGICFVALINPSGQCPPVTLHPQQEYNYQQQEFFTQNELNFQSTGESAFQWQAGLYSFLQHESQPVEAANPQEPALNFPVNAVAEGPRLLPHGNFPNRYYEDDVQFNDESLAVYGQGDYKFNDEFKLTAGLRYSYDHKWGREQSRLVFYPVAPEFFGAFTFPFDVTPPGPDSVIDYATCRPFDPGIVCQPGPTPGAVYNPATGFAVRKYDNATSAITGVVDLDWTPAEDTLVYAKYSRGYKGGGFNTGIGTFINPKPWVGAEHVNAFEVGLKKSFADWLVLDAAAYYYGYDDMQVPLGVAASPGGVNSVEFLSIPHAVSSGFEMESILTPIEHLTFTASYSLNDAHITSSLVPGLGDVLAGVSDPVDPNGLVPGAKPLFTPAQCLATAGTAGALCGVDIYTIGTAPSGSFGCPAAGHDCGWVIPQSLKGNRLPNAPRNKIALNLRYDWNFADFGIVTPSVTYVWRDAQYGTVFSRFYNRAPSWDQWDGRISFASPDGHWNLIIYGRNIGNHIGYDTGAEGTRYAGTVNRSCAGAPLLTGGSTAAGAVCNFVQGATLGAPTPLPPGYAGVPGESAYGTVSTFSVNPPQTYGFQIQFRF